MFNKDTVTSLQDEIQSIKDLCVQTQDQQTALIKDLQKDVLACKNSITEMSDMLRDVQIRVNDIQDRAYDLLYLTQKTSETQKNATEAYEQIADIAIRMQDVQDRVSNILNQKDDLNKIMTYNKDTQIRVKDSQDRIHDTLWKLKTQTAQINILFWNLYKKPSESLEESKYRFFREIPPATGDSREKQVVLSKLLHTVHNICVENNIAYWLDFGSLLGAVRHGGFIPWDDDIDLGMMRKDMDRLETILKEDKRFYVRNAYINRQNGNGILHLLQVRWADTELGTLRLYMDIFVYDYCQKCTHEDWQWYMNQKAELVKKSMSLPYGAFGEGDDQKLEILKQTFDQAKQKIDEHFEVTYEESDYILWGFENVNYLNYCDEHLFEYSVIFPLKKLNFEGVECYVPNKYLEYISSMYEDIFSLPDDILTHNHFEFNDIESEQLHLLYKKCTK